MTENSFIMSNKCYVQRQVLAFSPGVIKSFASE